MKFWKKQLLISTIYIGIMLIFYNFSSNEVSKIVGSLLTTVFVWVMNKTFSIDYQTKNEEELKEYQKKIDKEMEDYKNEWNKKLEDYKNKLEAELETHKAKLSGYTLVTKLQYDLEFKIYTEICDSVFELYVAVKELSPSFDTVITSEIATERIESFSNAYNEVSDKINKYRPFYSNNIFEIFLKIREIACSEGVSFERAFTLAHEKFNYKKSRKRIKNMKENIDESCKLIRERIENMKIVE